MTVRIAVIVEGDTETAFKECLDAFLKERLAGRMPKVQFKTQDGRIPKQEMLKKRVAHYFQGRAPFDHVIALTDVYTGTGDFKDAHDAKLKMRQWVGEGETRFTPHAAQYEFEAWLLPYWDAVKKLAKSDMKPPKARPEDVNHGDPPSKYIGRAFRSGSAGRIYSKTRDGQKILKNSDLMVSVQACLELKAFVNTILRLAGGEPIP